MNGYKPQTIISVTLSAAKGLAPHRGRGAIQLRLYDGAIAPQRDGYLRE